MADLNHPFMHQFGDLIYAYLIKSLAYTGYALLAQGGDYFQKEIFLWF